MSEAIDERAAVVPTAGPVGARVYRHWSLPERVVVRVVVERLAAAVDAEMALAGFERTEVHADLAAEELAPTTLRSWVEAGGLELPPGRDAKGAAQWVLEQAIVQLVGGLPPWSGILDDLRALAVRAGSSPSDLLVPFARAVLSAPEVPLWLWQGLEPVVRDLAQRDGSVRGRLLDRFPAAADDAQREEWLTLLHETGALAVIWDGASPADALPRGGRVEWFSRLCAWAGPRGAQVLPIARRAAALLANEGPPVVLNGPVDLDLLDLLTELGVPWVVGPQANLDLRVWARGTNVPARFDLPDEARPRDPVYAVQDPEVQELLAAAWPAAMCDAVCEEACGCTALAPLRTQWMHGQLGRVTGGSLDDGADGLAALEAMERSDSLCEIDRALAEVSFAPALARTLGVAVERVAPWLSDAEPDPEIDKALVARAKALEGRLVALRQRVPAPQLPDVADAALASALASVYPDLPGGDGSTVFPGIRALGAFLSAGALDADPVRCALNPDEWIGRIRALGWLGSRPGELDRQVLIALLRQWVGAGLADPASVRTGRLRFDDLHDWIPTHVVRGAAVPYPLWTAWLEDRRIIVLDCPEVPSGPWHARFVEWGPPGTSGPEWSGLVFTSAQEHDTTGDREWIEAFCSAQQRLGGRTVTEVQRDAFATATGLSAAQSQWVLDGCPPGDTHGLSLSRDTLLSLFAAAVPLDPGDLWTEAGAEGLAACWIDTIGKAWEPPTELRHAAESEIPDAAPLLAAICAPGTWPGLRQDAVWTVGRRGQIERRGDGFDPASLITYAQLVAWLVARLPVGDPLLVNVAKVHEQVSRRLANPQLVIDAGTWVTEPTTDAENWFTDLGGKLIEVEDADGRLLFRQRRAGPIVATFLADRITLGVEPANLDPAGRAVVAEFRRLSSDAQALLHTWELLRSPDFSSLVERIVRTPLGPGEWEQDPSRSAPHVVRIMARRHGLSDIAATLYLQVLVWIGPERGAGTGGGPSRAAVRRWNRWTDATVGQAADELVRNGLIVGLDDGWALPDGGDQGEAWKLPLYGWDGTAFPLGTALPLAPMHVLYARAWERCISGDPPPVAAGFEPSPRTDEPL